MIEYADEEVMTVDLTLGPQVAEMTDRDILDVLNADIEVRQEMAAAYEYVAVEVPIGSPQAAPTTRRPSGSTTRS